MKSIWKPALALSALLAVSGLATAGDSDTQQLTGGTTITGGSTTMTLGGKGTASQAATEDTELTHGYRSWGGYRGYGWGGGFRGYGWGGYGFRGGYGWGGYGWGGYRGYYGGNWGFPGYYRSAFYYPRFYYPAYYYYPSPVFYSGPSFGIYLGISGDTSTSVPAVNLGNGVAPAAPNGLNDGTFPYDGGPANPVPLPKAEPQSAPAPAVTTPISGKPAASPYKYKAYGEK